MSWLLLDLGNSRLKWGRVADALGMPQWQATGHGAAEAETLLEAMAGAVPTRILLCSVAAGERVAGLTKACEALWGFPLEQITSVQALAGLRSGYENPAQLGSDRWLAVLGAWQEFGASLVLDAGTACTADAVRADGQHLGGLIVPGRQMMHGALAAGTALIPDKQQAQVSIMASHTPAAVANGSLYCLAGFAQQLRLRLTSEMGGPFRCVLTGGDAVQLLPLLGAGWVHRPHLVLEGLMVAGNAQVGVSL